MEAGQEVAEREDVGPLWALSVSLLPVGLSCFLFPEG